MVGGIDKMPTHKRTTEQDEMKTLQVLCHNAKGQVEWMSFNGDYVLMIHAGAWVPIRFA
jgi:hypothetical protein